MIISVNWLKQFVAIDMPIDDLVALIGERLVEVEGTEDLSEKYKDVTIARVVSAQKMEDSDHLSLVYIDDGGVVDEVERTEDGLVQVVCGAPNVREGMLVAWLPPKSVVPETFATDDPFTLSARPLRGHVSNGMLASARELDLYDEHDGILEVDKDVTPGASFAETYELNDVLIDIENKSLTHRPDAFGLIGFAREVAGIQGKRFETPDWLRQTAADITPVREVADMPTISIEDGSLSERFQLIVIDNVNEKAASPIQMQTYLARSGVRPINAMVDISNYLMLLTGQPTHMYDYDKLKAVAAGDFTVGVRLAKKDERLTLLDGKDVALDTADIIITAGDTPVGLAGIMGGAGTMTDETTKTVALEVATFNLYNMRSSQMRHGIFSEAVTRYTKGVPAELGRPVLVQATNMASEFLGAEAVSSAIDAYPEVRQKTTISVTSDRVNRLLGTQFSAEDIMELLENVEFSVNFDEREGLVEVPYWRNDIHIVEDVIEEVGRLSGFDSINPAMPHRDFTAVQPTRFDDIRMMLRETMVRAGANEVLTYSFVHGDLLERVGQRTDNSYRIINSISPDLQYYRQSLTPSLLQHVNPNIRLGYDTFGLFEFNKVHEKKDGLTDESVPTEKNAFAFVLGAKQADGVAYYQTKYILEYVLKSIGVKAYFKPLEEPSGAREMPFEPQRSASVYGSDGVLMGVVGEYKSSVAKAFKMPKYAAGFELSVDAIEALTPQIPIHYTPLSRYPSVERDICFKVSGSVSYQDVISAAMSGLDGTELEVLVSPVDIYRQEDTETKNVTVRFMFTSHEKTLTSEEVGDIMTAISDKVIAATHGEVV